MKKGVCSECRIWSHLHPDSPKGSSVGGVPDWLESLWPEGPREAKRGHPALFTRLRSTPLLLRSGNIIDSRPSPNDPVVEGDPRTRLPEALPTPVLRRSVLIPRPGSGYPPDSLSSTRNPCLSDFSGRFLSLHRYKPSKSCHRHHNPTLHRYEGGGPRSRPAFFSPDSHLQ